MRYLIILFFFYIISVSSVSLRQIQTDIIRISQIHFILIILLKWTYAISLVLLRVYGWFNEQIRPTCKEVIYCFFVFDNNSHFWKQIHLQVSRVIHVLDNTTLTFSLLVNKRFTNAHSFVFAYIEFSQTFSLTCIQRLLYSDSDIITIVPNLNITISEMYRLT